MDTNYAAFLRPHAEKFLNDLKQTPAQTGLLRKFRRRDLSVCKTAHAYSASNFLVGNGGDPLAKKIREEFTRVFGRELRPISDFH